MAILMIILWRFRTAARILLRYAQHAIAGIHHHQRALFGTIVTLCLVFGPSCLLINTTLLCKMIICLNFNIRRNDWISPEFIKTVAVVGLSIIILCIYLFFIFKLFCSTVNIHSRAILDTVCVKDADRFDFVFFTFNGHLPLWHILRASASSAHLTRHLRLLNFLNYILSFDIVQAVLKTTIVLRLWFIVKFRNFSFASEKSWLLTLNTTGSKKHLIVSLRLQYFFSLNAILLFVNIRETGFFDGVLLLVRGIFGIYKHRLFQSIGIWRIISLQLVC